MSAAKYAIGALLGSFTIAYVFYDLTAHRMIFGGKVASTYTNKEWWEETDKKFQRWPREAGPPVVMNPIRRQNFIVKSSPSSSSASES